MTRTFTSRHAVDMINESIWDDMERHATRLGLTRTDLLRAIVLDAHERLDAETGEALPEWIGRALLRLTTLRMEAARS